MKQSRRSLVSHRSLVSRSSLVSRWVLCTGLSFAGFGGCYFDKFTKVDGQDGTGGRPNSSTGGSSSGGTDPGGGGGMGGEIISEVALAIDDEETTPQGDEILLDLLANDAGPGITFVSADDTDPSRPEEMDAAQFSVSSRGVLTFEPAPEFWGTYRAVYTIEDENGQESTGNISIHVVPESISLSAIEAGHGGFVVDGAVADFLGASVSAAGDVNGDGVDDFLIGAPGALNGPTASDTVGRVALVFGAPGLEDLDLSQDTSDRVQIFVGAGAGRFRAGVSVSRAGRINEDELDDIIIGAADNAEAGAAYIVYGSSNFPGPALTLSDVPEGSAGYTITGPSGRTGAVVSGGHDMNGDGKDDVLMYASDGPNVYVDFHTTNGTATGEGDLVFDTDQTSPSAAIVGDLFDDDARAEVITASVTELFLLRGGASWPANESEIAEGVTGWKEPLDGVGVPNVTAAGRFNGDDAPDLAYCNPNPSCKIVPTTADPDDYDLADGWEVSGFSAGPARLSGGGDLNNDGFDDLIFSEADSAYVVWGRSALPTTELDVTDLGDAGFSIVPSEGSLGRVSIIGDVNDDGIDDYAIAVPDFDTDKGRVYVLFGARTTVSN